MALKIKLSAITGLLLPLFLVITVQASPFNISGAKKDSVEQEEIEFVIEDPEQHSKDSMTGKLPAVLPRYLEKHWKDGYYDAPRPEQITLEEGVLEAAYIFEGEVVDSMRLNVANIALLIKIHKVFKGDLQEGTVTAYKPNTFADDFKGHRLLFEKGEIKTFAFYKTSEDSGAFPPREKYERNVFEDFVKDVPWEPDNDVVLMEMMWGCEYIEDPYRFSRVRRESLYSLKYNFPVFCSPSDVRDLGGSLLIGFPDFPTFYETLGPLTGQETQDFTGMVLEERDTIHHHPVFRKLREQKKESPDEKTPKKKDKGEGFNIMDREETQAFLSEHVAFKAGPEGHTEHDITFTMDNFVLEVNVSSLLYNNHLTFRNTVPLNLYQICTRCNS